MNGDLKPTFNVCEPFQGTIIVMTNDPMRRLLSLVIHELEEPVEPEVRALGLALYNPQKSIDIRRQKLESVEKPVVKSFFYTKPTFNVCEPFQGVIILMLNDSMRRLVSQVIHELDELEPEVRAFGLALYNPQKSVDIRRQKLESRAG